jgi:hypothetical protein
VVLRLAHLKGEATIGLDTGDGRLVRAAPIDGDFLRHVMHTDSLFEECAGRSMIALVAQQKIDGAAALVYRSVQVLPPARDFYVGVVPTQALSDRAL